MTTKTPLQYVDFKALLGNAKRKSDPLWCRFIYRPVSFPVGWVLYKMGITANIVSLFSIFLSFVSFGMIVFGEGNAIIFASLAMLLVSLADCVDGNIARARREAGPGGEWMDALSGYTVYALLPLAIGVHISLQNSSMVFPGFWVAIGALTAISNLFLRLVYQKYVNTIMTKINKTEDKGKGVILSKISGELGLVGWMMPALFISAIFNVLEFYLAFYCFFYLISACVITYVFARRIFDCSSE